TWYFHSIAGRRAACERSFMTCLQAPFDNNDVLPENRVLDDVNISRKAGDKGTNELISKGRLSIHVHAWNFQRHVFGVVGQDPVLIGSFPFFKVLVDECTNVAG